MHRNQAIYWAFFYYVKSIGPHSLLKLMRYFPNGKNAWQASSKEYQQAGISSRQRENILIERKQINPEKIHNALQKYGIGLLLYKDPLYPTCLKKIHCPPPLLFYKGNPQKLQGQNVAVVGTRKASSYGKKQAFKIAQTLSSQNITIVSGLAIGIDSRAHQAAFNQRGGTIAVLGGSLLPQDIYPPQAKNLTREIIENNGLILSESPPFIPLHPGCFPQRNRIIAGLSTHVIIIEAPLRSGALITANHALEENREILVLPGDIDRKSAQGTNELIRQGAGLICSFEDLQSIFNVSELPKSTPKYNSLENQIIQILETSPAPLDKLLNQMPQIPYNNLIETLTKLEMKKEVCNEFGLYSLRI